MSTRSFWVPFKGIPRIDGYLPRQETYVPKQERIRQAEKNRPPFVRARHPGRRRIILAALLIGILATLITVEIKTSWIQSRVFSRIADSASYDLAAGKSRAIHFPEDGPYNQRLGYSDVGELTYRLRAKAFAVDSQAVLSNMHQTLVDLGLFPLYREKSQAGLEITDRRGDLLFSALYPARAYRSFEEIPASVANTLLYIENRALLDQRYPYRNPAVEWDRFSLALASQLLDAVGIGTEAPGASTLATQLEKFRHSKDGLTGSAKEKLRQMMTASIRAYLDGPETITARKHEVVDYLNTMPLSGMPGYGEVIGLAEGLEVWFGSDFDQVNETLLNPNDLAAAGLAYRNVLSLLLANRRPSYLLGSVEGRAALSATTERYLPLLASAGVIDEELALAATKAEATVLETAVRSQPVSFIGRKAASAVRTDLLSLLGIEHLYDLDHLDLTVRTTYDAGVQTAVTTALERLRDAEFVRKMGMEGNRLLSGAEVSNVYYALTLYETDHDLNRLVVQSDNFDGPFNVNEGAKLELGSTAKLRTLVTYLVIVESLFDQYSGSPVADLRSLNVHRSDHITRWAVGYLAVRPDATLPEMLDASLNRTYSASPNEGFFTGGGLHTFQNFSASDNARVYTVRAGLRHSVNLVYIRLMRDVVSYYMHRLPGNPAAMLDDPADPRRTEYLERFADREGQQFLWQFHNRYQETDDLWSKYVSSHRLTPTRFAWAVRSVDEDISEEELTALLTKHHFAIPAGLYERTDARSFDWHDRGYLAGVHPLELWYLAYRHANPEATWSDIVPAGTLVRQEAYRWLFRPNARGGHDSRIRTLIEEEAFVEIHRQWQSVGYPFDRLVPSLATAIGSSADRPDALADLMGIILRGGLRYPSARIESLHFADGSPFETQLSLRPEAPTRAFSDEVSVALRGVLVDVVENGTAVRLRGGLTAADGSPLPIGGKTGTGDNRMRIYGSSGQLVGAKVQNRTSTFVFFIGDRWFGTVTAFVTGPEAGQYRFTSSLPVQLLKSLNDELQPLLISSK